MSLTLSDHKRNVVLQPNNPAMRLALAEALLGEGDWNGALVQLEKAVALDPARWEPRRLLARAYARDQRLPHAHRVLIDSVRLFPTDPTVRDELVELYTTARRHHDVLVQLDEVARLEPSNAQRWSTLGLALARLDLWDKAVEALEHAARVAPDDSVIARDLELVVRERRQQEGAREDELPTADAILASWSRELVGVAAEAARRVLGRDLQGAKRLLVTASPAEAGKGAFHAVKAEVALAEAKYPSARSALRKACELSPKVAVAWRRLGDAALLDGDFVEARANYQRAGELAPSDLTIRSALQQVEAAALRRPAPATATGRIGMMAWHATGGVVTPLQAEAIPGRGELVSTGNLGDELKGSMTLAHSFLRANAAKLGLENRLQTSDVHLHVTRTDSRSDGRSAGLAFTLASISALKDQPLPEGLAATGEITLQGEVVKIAGVHEKLIAAYLLGYRTAIVPRTNLPDVVELPVEVTSRMQLVYVRTIMEAYSLLFETPRSSVS